MKDMSNKQAISIPTSQSGAVLFTALVLMVLMTLLAVTMMGNTSMDEKMAQNSQDKNRAFQAAETGIEMAIANSGSMNTSNAFNPDGTNSFSQGDAATLGTVATGYGVNVTYSSVFLLKNARDTWFWFLILHLLIIGLNFNQKQEQIPVQNQRFLWVCFRLAQINIIKLRDEK